MVNNGVQDLLKNKSCNPRLLEHFLPGRRRWSCSACSFVTRSLEGASVVADHVRRAHPEAKIGCAEPGCESFVADDGGANSLESHRRRRHGIEDGGGGGLVVPDAEVCPVVHYFVRERETKGKEVNNNDDDDASGGVEDVFEIDEAPCWPLTRKGKDALDDHNYVRSASNGPPQEAVAIRDSRVSIQEVDLRAHACDLCGKKFCGPSELLCHLLRAGDAPHRRGARRGVAVQRLRGGQVRRCRRLLRVAGEPFACSVCRRAGHGYATDSFGQFSRHMRTRHMSKEDEETEVEGAGKSGAAEGEGRRNSDSVKGLKCASAELLGKLALMRQRKKMAGLSATAATARRTAATQGEKFLDGGSLVVHSEVVVE